MHEALLKKYELERYRAAIEAVKTPCLVGDVTTEQTESFCGGFPKVDAGFVWPMKDGYPLHFVAQLSCKDMSMTKPDSGALLFFYDNRHAGYSAEDLGHAAVLHQRGERELKDADLPTCEVKKLFGLTTARVRPQVYKRVGLRFRSGHSYPGLERKLIEFEDEGWEEAYGEFVAEAQNTIQMGGFPHPIQSDWMEDDCIKAFPIGTRNDWRLLLQLFEVGDMVWGDAGALYWFILNEDLEKGRFDRVWMVTQCG